MATEQQVHAAARKLLEEGNEHGWFPQKHTLETLDEIGREEFLDLTARVLSAAENVKETEIVPPQGAAC